MLKNNKAYLQILLTTFAGVLIIVSSLMFSNQNKKINELEEQLYLKQQNEQRATDYYESILNEKTIQSKFNTLHEYDVLKDCTIRMDHSYDYTSEGILGVKKHIALKGHGQLQYSACVKLDTAIVKSSNNGRDITIQIEEPYIDTNSIKLVQNSLVMQSAEYSFFSNKEDGAQAQKFFMDSFVDSGEKKIIDLYETQSKQEYLNRAAISEVHALVRTLNLTGNVNIHVELIK